MEKMHITGKFKNKNAFTQGNRIRKQKSSKKREREKIKSLRKGELMMKKSIVEIYTEVKDY